MDFPASHVEGNQRIRRLSRRNLGLAEQRMVCIGFIHQTTWTWDFQPVYIIPSKLPQIKKK
jgi:hypothetical protein